MSEHSLQTNSVADQYADIRNLKFSNGKISEVRLHHVFEHFNRPVACALVSTWSSWLNIGGVVRIEVPDYFRTSLSILNPLSSFRRKMVGIRHLFGSHEASWAYHYEGYDKTNLTRLLKANDFKIKKVLHNDWKGTYNIEIIAEKVGNFKTVENYKEANRNYMSNFLLDDSEAKLLDVWMEEYSNQLSKGFSQ
jgi:predicted SAM-dependent methyltransferase